MIKPLLILAALLAAPGAGDEHVNHTVLKKLAWQFAFPTDSLGNQSILEAGKVAKSLTVHHLEVVVGQPLSAEDATLLDSKLDDAKVAAFVKDLKSAGLDVASVRADVLPSAGEMAGLFRVAKGLGAKVVVLPSDGTGANDAAAATKLKVAVTGREKEAGMLGESIGVSALAGESNEFRTNITEARMTTDAAADRKLCEAMLKQGFKGTVTVQPEHKTEADTVAAMDAFAKVLHELPTTQP